MQATVNGFRMNFAGRGARHGTHRRAASSARHQSHHLGRADGGAAPRATAWCASMRAGTAPSEATKAPYDFAMLSADIIGLMDHLKIARAHFLGLSMGGMVGQHLGLDASAAFREPDPQLHLEPHPGRGAAAVGRARQGRAREGHGLAGGRWRCRAGSPPRALKGKPGAGRAHDAGTSRRRRWRATSAGARRSADLNVTDRLKGIKLPTRVIVGAEDVGTPPAAAEAIHREIAGSDLVVVPGVVAHAARGGAGDLQQARARVPRPAAARLAAARHGADPGLCRWQPRTMRASAPHGPERKVTSLQRVLVLGGYGAFGGRVAERLARVPGIEVIVAGRARPRRGRSRSGWRGRAGRRKVSGHAPRCGGESPPSSARWHRGAGGDDQCDRPLPGAGLPGGPRLHRGGRALSSTWRTRAAS